MATSLTSIFGTEINVLAEPSQIERQYRKFAGANGVVSRFMGSMGRPLIVVGTLRASGGSFDSAKSSLQDIVDGIDAAMKTIEADDYSHAGETFEDVVWDNFEIIKDANGSFYKYNADGTCLVKFIATGRLLNG